jgi:glycosyltransferase involved in cell wall biosynthesis
MEHPVLNIIEMEEQPLVSLCIPAYNSAHYILQTLESIFNQSYSNIEVIVVNDGSTDNTLSILKGIAHLNLHVFPNIGKGASAARNTAYKNSTGNYIKFLDADDVINGTCIETQVQHLKNKVDCVASAKWGRFFKNDLSDFLFSPELVWKTMPGIDWVIESIIESGSNMTQPGIFLIPRTIIEKVGLWDESISLIDDFDFMTRVLTASNEVVFCEDAILYYRGGLSNSLSMQRSRKSMESAYQAQIKGIEIILNKKLTEKSKLACANSLQLWAHAFYPLHKDLYNKACRKIRELGGSNVKMDGGKLFHFMRATFGWQTAKRIKLFFDRFRKTDITNPKFLIPNRNAIK